MSKQSAIKIYPGPPLRAWMADRPVRRSMLEQAQQGGGETITDSVAVNRLAERYQLALAQDFPRLHEQTWLAVGNALSGTTETAVRDILTLGSLVADDIGHAPEDDENDTEFEALPLALREIKDCNTIQRLAIVEVIERIWGSPSPEESRSLREVISGLSRRPLWSVYRDDPEPEAFWQAEPGEAAGRWRVTHTECPSIVVEVSETAGGRHTITDTQGLDEARVRYYLDSPDGPGFVHAIFEAVGRRRNGPG